jgi:hypothetical protein
MRLRLAKTGMVRKSKNRVKAAVIFKNIVNAASRRKDRNCLFFARSRLEMILKVIGHRWSLQKG